VAEYLLICLRYLTRRPISEFGYTEVPPGDGLFTSSCGREPTGQEICDLEDAAETSARTLSDLHFARRRTY
jgi:hypothetical protein